VRQEAGCSWLFSTKIFRWLLCRISGADFPLAFKRLRASWLLFDNSQKTASRASGTASIFAETASA